LNFLVHIIRILLSAIIGYYFSEELELEGMIRIVFFFGVYIVVSITIELIKRIFTKNKIA